MYTTDQALFHMEQDLKNKRDMRYLSTSPTWLIAFADYNTLNANRMNVNCASCYMKVFLWHKERLK